MTAGEARQILEDMVDQEQSLVNRINAISRQMSQAPKVLLDELDQQRRHHAKQLMDIVSALKSWPTIKLVGEKAVQAAWLVSQHAVMMTGIRETICDLMKTAADQGEIPGWHFPFYYDRVQQLQGKPQKFGTQMMMHSHGYPVPYDLEDHMMVDQWRAQYGLPSLQEALKQLQAYV